MSTADHPAAAVAVTDADADADGRTDECAWALGSGDRALKLAFSAQHSSRGAGCRLQVDESSFQNRAMWIQYLSEVRWSCECERGYIVRRGRERGAACGVEVKDGKRRRWET